MIIQLKSTIYWFTVKKLLADALPIKLFYTPKNGSGCTLENIGLHLFSFPFPSSKKGCSMTMEQEEGNQIQTFFLFVLEYC